MASLLHLGVEPASIVHLDEDSHHASNLLCISFRFYCDWTFASAKNPFTFLAASFGRIQNGYICATKHCFCLFSENIYTRDMLAGPSETIVPR